MSRLFSSLSLFFLHGLLLDSSALRDNECDVYSETLNLVLNACNNLNISMFSSIQFQHYADTI